MTIEKQILSNLINDEDYCRKVAPFINPQYFADRTDRILSQEILKFFSKYNKPATRDVLLIEVSNRRNFFKSHFN
jgi:hypothetical protein